MVGDRWDLVVFFIIWIPLTFVAVYRASTAERALRNVIVFAILGVVIIFALGMFKLFS